MKIAIDIDDEDYKRIQNISYVFDSLGISITSRTYLAIINGTPLPEHHGRLIDADAITKDVKTLQNSFVINIDNTTGKILGCECLAPTIIEGSDKE